MAGRVAGAGQRVRLHLTWNRQALQRRRFADNLCRRDALPSSTSTTPMRGMSPSRVCLCEEGRRVCVWRRRSTSGPGFLRLTRELHMRLPPIAASPPRLRRSASGTPFLCWHSSSLSGSGHTYLVLVLVLVLVCRHTSHSPTGDAAWASSRRDAVSDGADASPTSESSSSSRRGGGDGSMPQRWRKSWAPPSRRTRGRSASPTCGSRSVRTVGRGGDGGGGLVTLEPTCESALRPFGVPGKICRVRTYTRGVSVTGKEGAGATACGGGLPIAPRCGTPSVSARPATARRSTAPRLRATNPGFPAPAACLQPKYYFQFIA